MQIVIDHKLRRRKKGYDLEKEEETASDTKFFFFFFLSGGLVLLFWYYPASSTNQTKLDSVCFQTAVEDAAVSRISVYSLQHQVCCNGSPHQMKEVVSHDGSRHELEVS